MKKIRHLALAITSALAAGGVTNSFAESEVDLYFSSDMVAVDYLALDGPQGGVWGAGALYNEESDAIAVSGLAGVVGDSNLVDDLRTTIGVKGIIHDTFQTALSVAVGGTARYAPADFQGFGVEGRLFYAPSILNTNDADEYRELGARVTYDLNPRARLFVGFANVVVDYDNAPEVDLNDSLNLGVSLRF